MKFRGRDGGELEVRFSMGRVMYSTCYRPNYHRILAANNYDWAFVGDNRKMKFRGSVLSVSSSYDQLRW